jgi:CRP/FNR family transcriptional regulator, cyclic AMP receptor protein
MVTMADLITEQQFFAGMRPRHLERLSYYARRSVYRGGARIFSEGAHANRCWIIRDGAVRLDAHVPGGPDVAIETLGPGAVLGWSWLFPPYTWQFSAVATDPTLAIEFPGAELRQLSAADPELGYELTSRLIGVVVERLQATRARLINTDRV